MNRLLFCFAFFLVCLSLSSQVNYDDFVGTWVYQKNDTIFKIKLQKGRVSYDNAIVLFGGYSLSVRGVVTDNYIGGTIPSVWNVYDPAPSKNIYIDGFGNTLNRVGITFYDQRKKHLNGEGIGGGVIRLIAPNKIHWTLNEREGLWPYLEGEQVEGPTIEEAIQGFSVPTDVIMIKEE